MLTLEYLMFEAYSKPCQISKMMRHIENLDIVRTLYSGIFMHSSGSFRNIQAYWRTLRHIETYSGIIKAYWAKFRHSKFWVTIAYTNHAILRTLAHLEPEAFSKAWQICKMIRHIQRSGKVRTVNATILKDI